MTKVTTGNLNSYEFKMRVAKTERLVAKLGFSRQNISVVLVHKIQDLFTIDT